MENRRLLISLAHPDDESFGSGGLISRYADEGVDIHLICATNGDVGAVPEDMNGYKSLAELRLAELECAASTLGIKQLHTFGYKDSGMMGSPTTKDPECLWYNWQNNPDEVIRRVVETIRTVKPQVLVTFNRYGGYGHPDHIAIQRATEEAFKLAADPTYQAGDLPPHRAQKFYYTNIPALMLRVGIWWMRLRGQDPRKIGANKDIDLVAVLENAEPSHTQINVKNYLDQWDEANACHASQGGGGPGGLIPRWLRTLVSAKQGLTRIYPKPRRNRIDETDLFAGVILEETASESTALEPQP